LYALPGNGTKSWKGFVIDRHLSASGRTIINKAGLQRAASNCKYYKHFLALMLFLNKRICLSISVNSEMAKEYIRAQCIKVRLSCTPWQQMVRKAEKALQLIGT
jgi:hypothetical protein